MTENLSSSEFTSHLNFMENIAHSPHVEQNITELRHLGHYFLLMEQYQKAERIFTQLIDIISEDWELLHGLGIALLKQNKISRALTYFTIIQDRYSDKIDVSDFLDYFDQEMPFEFKLDFSKTE